MSDEALSLDQLETYADQLREMAPALRDEAAALPPHLLGSSELSQQYAELMRRVGAVNESLARNVEDFAALYRRHLTTATALPASAPSSPEGDA